MIYVSNMVDLGYGGSRSKSYSVKRIFSECGNSVQAIGCRPRFLILLQIPDTGSLMRPFRTIVRFFLS